MRKITACFLLVALIFIAIGCGGSENLMAKDRDKDPQSSLPESTVVTKDSTQRNYAGAKLDPIQEKYAPLLGVIPEDVDNIKLYTFVDKWLDTPYIMGGESEQGIDCSAFTQQLFVKVYNYLPERTARKQYDSKSTAKFMAQQDLKEGDMLFFKKPKSRNQTVTHVGIYLKNNKFISASGYKGPERFRGVKISDLTDPWWQERFLCAGRKPLTRNKEKE